MTTVSSPRRRRWPWVLLALALLVAVLIVAAELIARAVVPNTVRSLVIEQLDLPADQQIDVQTPGMMLPQLLVGTLDEVRLDSDRVTLEGITGSARVVATDVPIRGGDLGSAKGTVSIDQSEFASLLEGSGLPDAQITLRAPDVTAEGTVAVLGLQTTVGITVTPGVQDGALLLTPVSVSVAGQQVDLPLLASFLGAPGEKLAGPHLICIADRLPAGLTLTGLRIEGTRAVADITADPRIATDPTLLNPGIC